MAVVGDPTGAPFPPKPAPQPCAVPQEPVAPEEVPEGEEEEEDEIARYKRNHGIV